MTAIYEEIGREATNCVCTFRGTITALDSENNAADVATDNYGAMTAVPIHYHCQGQATVANGHRAFKSGDAVLLVGILSRGDDPTPTTAWIVGHEEYRKPCAPDCYVIFTVHNNITNTEKCIVWNIGTNAPAEIEGVSFPCDPSEIEAWRAGKYAAESYKQLYNYPEFNPVTFEARGMSMTDDNIPTSVVNCSLTEAQEAAITAGSPKYEDTTTLTLPIPDSCGESTDVPDALWQNGLIDQKVGWHLGLPTYMRATGPGVIYQPFNPGWVHHCSRSGAKYVEGYYEFQVRKRSCGGGAVIPMWDGEWAEGEQNLNLAFFSCALSSIPLTDRVTGAKSCVRWELSDDNAKQFTYVLWRSAVRFYDVNVDEDGRLSLGELITEVRNPGEASDPTYYTKPWVCHAMEKVYNLGKDIDLFVGNQYYNSEDGGELRSIKGLYNAAAMSMEDERDGQEGPYGVYQDCGTNILDYKNEWVAIEPKTEDWYVTAGGDPPKDDWYAYSGGELVLNEAGMPEVKSRPGNTWDSPEFDGSYTSDWRIYDFWYNRYTGEIVPPLTSGHEITHRTKNAWEYHWSSVPQKNAYGLKLVSPNSATDSKFVSHTFDVKEDIMVDTADMKCGRKSAGYSWTNSVANVMAQIHIFYYISTIVAGDRKLYIDTFVTASATIDDEHDNDTGRKTSATSAEGSDFFAAMIELSIMSNIEESEILTSKPTVNIYDGYTTVYSDFKEPAENEGYEFQDPHANYYACMGNMKIVPEGFYESFNIVYEASRANIVSLRLSIDILDFKTEIVGDMPFMDSGESEFDYYRPCIYKLPS